MPTASTCVSSRGRRGSNVNKTNRCTRIASCFAWCESCTGCRGAIPRAHVVSLARQIAPLRQRPSLEGVAFERREQRPCGRCEMRAAVVVEVGAAAIRANRKAGRNARLACGVDITFGAKLPADRREQLLRIRLATKHAI